MLAIALRIADPPLLQQFVLQCGVTNELPLNGACSKYGYTVMAVNFKITWVTVSNYALLPFSQISALKNRK
jgi:hypothetical protein